MGDVVLDVMLFEPQRGAVHAAVPEQRGPDVVERGA